MKRPVQALLLVLSGLGLLHVTVLSDVYLRYVKEGMHPLLVASGLVLLLLGSAEGWSAYRSWALCTSDSPGDHGNHDDHDSEDTAGDDDRDAGGGHGAGSRQGHGHDHSRPPRAAWLLFLPALSLLLYAPPALGAYTAAREAPKPLGVQKEFDPLPATSPLPITLGDFTRRVRQDEERAVEGRTVLMAGFVTPDGDGWYLTRLILNCCAADAQSVRVRMYGVPAPKADTWVAVTGTWHHAGTLGTDSAEVALDARTVREIAKPSNGYTDAVPLLPAP
ncbi:TIGR03943 family putative permease subunit [Streptomyces sp. bgisy159]|uniref:TIGR03943 family putative permease subunit n=1 Tax=Streptomyces sp. bgisy159 TaxID=3413795 RepID=UPI003F49F8BE